MAEGFPYDVFLSHSAKDKAIVRNVAERLRQDGLEHSIFGLRVSDFGIAQPGMSANAFGSDWAQLEAATCGRGNLPFRDSLNQERSFMFELQPSEFILQPCLDAPIKGSLAQFRYINWPQAERERRGGLGALQQGEELPSSA